MKAYQKYVKEHQDEIHEALSNLLYILGNEDYEQYDYAGTTFASDKLKRIDKKEYATLHCAKCLLDVMSINDIEITLNIAYKIGYATRYIASYTPFNQISDDLRLHLYEVSKEMLDKAHKAHMKELYKKD